MGKSVVLGVLLVGPASTWAGAPTPTLRTNIDVVCALDAAGQVTCGASAAARESGVSRPRPGTYTALAVGPLVGCGLRDDGAIFCWGNDEFGAATPPSGRFVQVGAGCGLREDRTVACWGENGMGQADAPSGTWDHVAVGNSERCAWTDAGRIACWGGSGAKAVRKVPRELWGAGVARLDIGHAGACALGRDQRVRCWGDKKRFFAMDAPGGTFLDVSTDGDAACGVTTLGEIRCWTDRSADRVVDELPAGPGFTQVDVANSHACAMRDDGAVVCWGMDPPALAR